MNKTTAFVNEDLGKLLQRIAVGGMMLPYGIGKMIHGHDFIKGMLSEKGLPQFLWLGVPLTEVVAPLLLICGIFTRLSGLGIALVMVFSIVLAGLDLFALNAQGGLATDLNLLFLLGGLAIFFMGGGKYALYRPANKWLQ